MWNAWLNEEQAGIKIARRNLNNLRYADDTTLMAESKEDLKSLLMKVKKESEKAGCKLNIQKTNIMASDPITSWQIDGARMETVTDFIFWAPISLQMVTAVLKIKDACSLVEKLWQRQHFADKGLYSQSYGFSRSHVECESWTIKKAECWRTDTFKLRRWRRYLRVLWTARRSISQS